jgi:hypothetical protein
MGKEEKMTFAQRLTRKRPKLMRKWKDDNGGTYSIEVSNDLDSRAVVIVRLQFSSGRTEEIEMPLS